MAEMTDAEWRALADIEDPPVRTPRPRYPHGVLTEQEGGIPNDAVDWDNATHVCRKHRVSERVCRDEVALNGSGSLRDRLLAYVLEKERQADALSRSAAPAYRLTGEIHADHAQALRALLTPPTPVAPVTDTTGAGA